ncbi:DUF6343 family protein [Streptomyces sp. NPDC056796]
MRLWLSLWGMAWAAFGLAAFAVNGRTGWAAACGVLLVVMVTDLCFIVRHMRQGPRYQPGRDVPPYPPQRRGRDAPPYEAERDAEDSPPYGAERDGRGR